MFRFACVCYAAMVIAAATFAADLSVFDRSTVGVADTRMEVQRVAEELEEAERRRQAEVRAAIEEAERKGTHLFACSCFRHALTFVRASLSDARRLMWLCWMCTEREQREAEQRARAEVERKGDATCPATTVLLWY